MVTVNGIIGRYQNGNYTVTIYADGTKVRKNNSDILIPSLPESIDLKITNCCDKGCKYCHENSRPDGKHADIMSASFLDKMHPYMEIAIGGGNPLEHPDLEAFLIMCKEKKYIPSMTVNQTHFINHYDFIKNLVDRKLIYGLGISLTEPTKEFIDKVKTIPNAVVHTIAGVTTIHDYRQLANHNIKILVLGYKHFRRGDSYYSVNSAAVENQIHYLFNNLYVMTKEKWFDVISFDNLAIAQLDPKRLMSEDEWSEFYMGDDGFATMYVDMVERKYALNSCAPVDTRKDILPTIDEMFEDVRK